MNGIRERGPTERLTVPERPRQLPNLVQMGKHGGSGSVQGRHRTNRRAPAIAASSMVW
jgi:hypothetical protein